MSTITVNTEQSPVSTENEEYWASGRVTVHTVGNEAGSIRLDMDLRGVATAAEAKESVKLVIPGELSPLKAMDAVGEDGRFVISYFSSDIANSGHLPADAVVCWDSDGHENHTQSVSIMAAETVEQIEGKEAANVPGGKPMDLYPKTVVLLAILAVVFLMSCVIAVLSIN